MDTNQFLLIHGEYVASYEVEKTPRQGQKKSYGIIEIRHRRTGHITKVIIPRKDINMINTKQLYSYIYVTAEVKRLGDQAIVKSVHNKIENWFQDIKSYEYKCLKDEHKRNEIGLNNEMEQMLFQKEKTLAEEQYFDEFVNPNDDLGDEIDIPPF
jgi:hypothetical protein